MIVTVFLIFFNFASYPIFYSVELIFFIFFTWMVRTDIKPYIPAFDSFPTARAGWMDDICTDVDKSREQGYQNIISNRGARAARQFQRNKAISEGKMESEIEGKLDSATESENEIEMMKESGEKTDSQNNPVNIDNNFNDIGRKEESTSRTEENTENR